MNSKCAELNQKPVLRFVLHVGWGCACFLSSSGVFKSLSSPDPRLVSFVKARKAQKTPGSDVAGQAQSSGQRGRGDGEETPSSVPVPVPDLVMDVRDDRQGEPLQVDMEDEEEELVEDEEETPEATKDITGE